MYQISLEQHRSIRTDSFTRTSTKPHVRTTQNGKVDLNWRCTKNENDKILLRLKSSISCYDQSASRSLCRLRSTLREHKQGRAKQLDFAKQLDLVIALNSECHCVVRVHQISLSTSEVIDDFQLNFQLELNFLDLPSKKGFSDKSPRRDDRK